ncbi:hypothetical protein AB0D49_08515 [Streptomyces sp. NPDC048290]|uniref:hypothetical protein n=1 Tax=Streptomyces sp. NPDC048290 TaxID=3155811 RepID=UPI0034326EAD
MKRRIDGPIPVYFTQTETGLPAIDVSRWLARAVLAEVFQAADAEPEGLGEEFADMHALGVSAQHQGDDSHARHEYDARVERYVDEFADGGLIPLSVGGLRQLRDACDEMLRLRSADREAGAA